MLRRVGLLAIGGTVYAGATLASFVYFKKEECCPDIDQKQRTDIFNANASKYDKDIGREEWLAGITSLRKRLMNHANGRVLEIGSGTGRNLPHYPSECDLVCVDLSPAMLDEAQTRHPSPPVRSLRFDVMNSEDIKFPDNSFDTVVDTFGLCSVDNPQLVVKEMVRVCKPEGTILLLEHGRSSYTWLNSLLDKYAGKHALKWGCFWNRDIDHYLHQSGLVIQTHQLHHFNTTHYVVATKRNDR
eukprot:jgi/Bigna1/54598/estExt_Genewise1Plus.C_380038